MVPLMDRVLELPAVRVFTLHDDTKEFLEEGSLRVIVTEFEGKEVHILHVKEFKLSLVRLWCSHCNLTSVLLFVCRTSACRA